MEFKIIHIDDEIHLHDHIPWSVFDRLYDEFESPPTIAVSGRETVIALPGADERKIRYEFYDFETPLDLNNGVHLLVLDVNNGGKVEGPVIFQQARDKEIHAVFLTGYRYDVATEEKQGADVFMKPPTERFFEYVTGLIKNWLNG